MTTVEVAQAIQWIYSPLPQCRPSRQRQRLARLVQRLIVVTLLGLLTGVLVSIGSWDYRTLKTLPELLPEPHLQVIDDTNVPKRLAQSRYLAQLSQQFKEAEGKRQRHEWEQHLLDTAKSEQQMTLDAPIAGLVAIEE